MKKDAALRTDAVLFDAQQPCESVELAVSGDVAALTLLLTRTRSSLCRYLAQRIARKYQNLITPDDVVQETHAAIFRGIRLFTPDDVNSFERWMKTIALFQLRSAIARARTNKRGDHLIRRFASSPTDQSTINLFNTLASREDSPTKCLRRGEALDAMHAAMKQLSEDCRQAISLVYIEGLAVGIAAERMGRTERAIHGLCRRGREKLRTLLHQDHVTTSWLQ